MLRKGHIKENDLWLKLGNSLLSLIVFIETSQNFVMIGAWVVVFVLGSNDKKSVFKSPFLFKINIKAFFCTSTVSQKEISALV